MSTFAYLFIGSSICFTYRKHLSSNLFFLYIFGKCFNLLFEDYLPETAPSNMQRYFKPNYICLCNSQTGKLVEEEEGNFALWVSYIITGVGANLVSWLVLPRNAVSIGASGAVFGLFAISVLVKVS